MSREERMSCVGPVLLMARSSSIGLSKDKLLTSMFIWICSRVWPFVSHHATRKGYWFQQDSAKAHTAVNVRSWLTEKFHERVISHMMDRIWPPCSPDLSPLDYWFWGACLQELRRSPPRSIDELKATVEAYAASLTPEEISKAVLDILPRAEACILAEGGAFEYRLKQHKRLNGGGDNAQ